MHKSARKAAVASMAAEKQGKFLELTKVFLDNFKKLNDQTIKKYATELGLDMQKFEKALKDPALNQMVTQDTRLGKQVGVRGVPALFINGRSAKKRSLKDLSEMVEQELKKGP